MEPSLKEKRRLVTIFALTSVRINIINVCMIFEKEKNNRESPLYEFINDNIAHIGNFESFLYCKVMLDLLQGRHPYDVRDLLENVREAASKKYLYEY